MGGGEASVINRAGKATGKNQCPFNVQHDGDKTFKSVNFEGRMLRKKHISLSF